MLLAYITALATFCQACGSRGAWWWCSPLPPLSWACAEASNVRTSTPSEAINSSPLNPADFFKRAIQPSNPNPLDTRTDARCSASACCGVGSNMWASPSAPTSAVTLTSGPPTAGAISARMEKLATPFSPGSAAQPGDETASAISSKARREFFKNGRGLLWILLRWQTYFVGGGEGAGPTSRHQARRSATRHTARPGTA